MSQAFDKRQLSSLRAMSCTNAITHSPNGFVKWHVLRCAADRDDNPGIRQALIFYAAQGVHGHIREGAAIDITCRRMLDRHKVVSAARLGLWNNGALEVV